MGELTFIVVRSEDGAWVVQSRTWMSIGMTRDEALDLANAMAEAIRAAGEPVTVTLDATAAPTGIRKSDP